VAIVQVADVVKGTKGLKMVRVGFFPPPNVVPPGGPGGGVRPGIRPGIRPGFGGNVQLKVGDAGLFYLAKHFKEPLYTIPGMYDFTARANGNYDKELQEARANTQLLADPIKGLKSDDKSKRFLTAALLITQYRRGLPGKTKSEPISAEESKQILLALADANEWNTPQRFGQLHPQNLFFQLGVTNKDGWQPPPNFNEMPNAIRTWLRNHANTYRIQRVVPAAG